MRYIAPPREAVDPQVFARMPLAAWREAADWLKGPEWPSVDDFNARLPAGAPVRFVAQTRELLDDGLHYEQRIAQRGLIATRERNWHDLFNALAWLRFPELKRALNARQVAEIARMGTKWRSRAQYALTHFDEAGVVVTLRDPSLLALWDAHDWHGLFWREREAWRDGRIEVSVFGHALPEHALASDKLLVGKALVVMCGPGQEENDSSFRRRPGSGGGASDASKGEIIDACAHAIRNDDLLRDPLELRPLPLSGIPGWHPEGETENFHRITPCYQPLRAGRAYPAPLPLEASEAMGVAGIAA